MILINYAYTFGCAHILRAKIIFLFLVDHKIDLQLYICIDYARKTLKEEKYASARSMDRNIPK